MTRGGLEISRCSQFAGISRISPLCSGNFLPSAHSMVMCPLKTCKSSCLVSLWRFSLQNVPFKSTTIFSILLLHTNIEYIPLCQRVYLNIAYYINIVKYLSFFYLLKLQNIKIVFTLAKKYSSIPLTSVFFRYKI